MGRGPTNPGHNAWKRQTRNQEGSGKQGAFLYELEFGHYYKGLFSAPLGGKAPERPASSLLVAALRSQRLHGSPKSRKSTDWGSGPDDQ